MESPLFVLMLLLHELNRTIPYSVLERAKLPVIALKSLDSNSIPLQLLKFTWFVLILLLLELNRAMPD